MTQGEQFSMVDQERGTYRPRRAFIEADVEPAPPERPTPERPTPERPAQPGRNGNGLRPARPLAENQPKPLYRDDARPNGLSRPIPRAAPLPVDPPTAETLMTPATLAPRRPLPTVHDETTTILPRSRPTKHRTQALDAIDDFDDERRPLGRRGNIALLPGVGAVVDVIGL